ncbi:MAG: hypothetical protein ACI8QY_000491 [bacterium]|jgi:hypothetical protein
MIQNTLKKLGSKSNQTPLRPLSKQQSEVIYKKFKDYVEDFERYESLGVTASAQLRILADVPTLTIELNRIDTYIGKNISSICMFVQHTPTLDIYMYQNAQVELVWRTVTSGYIVGQTAGDVEIAFIDLFKEAQVAPTSKRDPLGFIRAVSYFNLVVGRKIGQLLRDIDSE